MKNLLTYSTVMILALALLLSPAYAKKPKKQTVPKYYGARLCQTSPDYYCLKVKRGDTWKKLWPNRDVRDLIKRLNRMNMRLRTGMRLAVPNDLKEISIWSISPFPRQIKAPGIKVIIVDQNILAWAAYDSQGELQWWGPISSGKNYCPDVKRNCYTKSGAFYIFNKEGKRCESSKFPVGRGGAKMPYCMFFYRGFALHGSAEVPGFRDSHGCVRMYPEDAKWLNKYFITLSDPRTGRIGTKVIVRELIGKKQRR